MATVTRLDDRRRDPAHDALAEALGHLTAIRDRHDAAVDALGGVPVDDDLQRGLDAIAAGVASAASLVASWTLAARNPA